jgi:hypothetical protein
MKTNETTKYTMDYTDGRTCGYEWTSEQQAKRAVAGLIDGAVFGEWEQHTPDSSRMLVWASEAEADNDSGEKAVAQIIRSID